jgi:hypothetical protein
VRVSETVVRRIVKVEKCKREMSVDGSGRREKKKTSASKKKNEMGALYIVVTRAWINSSFT